MTRAHLEWAETVILKPEGANLGFFRSKPSNRLASVFDSAGRYRFPIEAMLPSDGFFRRLDRDIRVSDKGQSVRNGGLVLGSFKGSLDRVSVERFPTNVASVRVEVSIDVGQSMDLDDVLATVQHARDEGRRTSVSTIFDHLHELLSTDIQASKPNRRSSAKVDLGMRAGEFGAQYEGAKRSIAQFHIGAARLAQVGYELADALTATSLVLNIKSDSERLLINEQGVSYLLPGIDYVSPHNDRYRRTLDLHAIAAVMQCFLLTGGGIANDAETQDTYRTFCRWIDFPRNALIASVTNQKTWAVCSDAMALSPLAREWATLGSM